MVVATKATLNDLAEEYLDYIEELLSIDPSIDEEAQEDFFACQEWGEDIQARAREAGFTWEQVEDAGSDLELN